MTQHDDCYCDLAPLYALGVLDEPTQRWVEAQGADLPELATELAAFQVAVQAIPYSAPVMPLASAVKQRLFDQLGCPLPTAATVSTSKPDAVSPPGRSARQRWRPYLAPGIQMKLLHYDRQTREVVALVRAEAGAIYPAHEHREAEDIYMLEGDLTIADATYHPGDYLRSSPGSTHGAATTTAGCQFLLRTVQSV